MKKNDMIDGKKKVCFLIGNLNNSGGTERVTSLIASALSELDNYEVYILSLSEGNTSFFRLDKKIKIDSLFSKPGSFKIRFIQTVFKIRSFIKKNKIDTLVVVDSISCLFTTIALFNLKTKHICWEHFNFLNNNGRILRDIARKMAAKYCDVVVTLTKRDKELWESGVTDIRAQIIPIMNPCPFNNVNHVPKLESKVVLSVGRLVHVKGFDLLIEAWSKVCEYRQDWMLWIIGNGEEELKLKEQAKSLKIEQYIKFIPATSNIEPYYEQASLYCMSSRFEGFPMVLLEAQAYGLPIISFNCDTGPNEIIKHGNNGLLVADFDIKGMSESLLRMMNLCQEQYDDFVLKSVFISKMFGISKVIMNWIKIL